MAQAGCWGAGPVLAPPYPCERDKETEAWEDLRDWFKVPSPVAEEPESQLRSVLLVTCTSWTFILAGQVGDPLP